MPNRFVGATGKTALNIGQKGVEFKTNAGQDRRCTFQCSDVNKILACVAGLAEGGGLGQENLVIFSTRGGVITPEAKTTLVLLSPDLVTEFDRKGHVYVMDAWVSWDKASLPKQPHFTRPARR